MRDREDVRRLSPEDVELSFEQLRLRFYARTSTGVAPAVAAIETPDARTVVFRLHRPHPALLRWRDVTEAQMLPAHLFGGTDPTGDPALREAFALSLDRAQMLRRVAFGQGRVALAARRSMRWPRAATAEQPGSLEERRATPEPSARESRRCRHPPFGPGCRRARSKRRSRRMPPRPGGRTTMRGCRSCCRTPRCRMPPHRWFQAGCADVGIARSAWRDTLPDVVSGKSLRKLIRRGAL
jgi:hypothetical protein